MLRPAMYTATPLRITGTIARIRRLKRSSHALVIQEYAIVLFVFGNTHGRRVGDSQPHGRPGGSVGNLETF